MSIIKKLPDAEFEIMTIVWSNEPPISTHLVMEQLGKEKVWKAQTIITLLTRLEQRGFLRKEKTGKELAYYPIVKRDDYLMFESSNFLERFHKNSFMNLVSTLYNGKQMNESDLKELDKWLKDKR